MKTILSGLTRQLYACENTLERMTIANQIFELLEHDTFDFGSTELVIRDHFKVRLKAFALNPTPQKKRLLSRLATFYKRNYAYRPELLPFAA